MQLHSQRFGRAATKGLPLPKPPVPCSGAPFSHAPSHRAQIGYAGEHQCKKCTLALFALAALSLAACGSACLRHLPARHCGWPAPLQLAASPKKASARQVQQQLHTCFFWFSCSARVQLQLPRPAPAGGFPTCRGSLVPPVRGA